jgi:hypothetical protein
MQEVHSALMYHSQFSQLSPERIAALEANPHLYQDASPSTPSSMLGGPLAIEELANSQNCDLESDRTVQKRLTFPSALQSPADRLQADTCSPVHVSTGLAPGNHALMQSSTVIGHSRGECMEEALRQEGSTRSRTNDGPDMNGLSHRGSASSALRLQESGKRSAG